MADKKDQLLIAAIDFGTTLSGYAFSFENDYKMDPLKISTNPYWVAGSRSLMSLKAPTCVLLSPGQEFEAFGYEAEDLYSELALDENHYDYYFFKGFKIVINEKRQLSKSMLIKDDKGNEAPALYVFAQVIRYLKNHLNGRSEFLRGDLFLILRGYICVCVLQKSLCMSHNVGG